MTPDPFESNLKLGWGSILKCVFFHVTLITPLKLLLAFLSFLITAFLNFVVLRLLAPKGQFQSEKYYQGWRAKISPICQYIYGRTYLFFLGYYRIKVNGQLDPSTRVLVCNHCTAWDNAILFSVAGVVGIPVTLTTVLKTPVMGTIGKNQHCLAFDRSSVTSREDFKKEMLAVAQDSRLPPIMVFPEGCCTNGRTVIHFKPGAFSVGQPVQVMAIKHGSPQMGWTPKQANAFYLWWVASWQLYMTLEISFSPVIPAEPNALEDFAAQQRQSDKARQVMADIMGVPLSDFRMEDSILVAYAHDKFRANLQTPLYSEIHQKYPQAKIPQMKEALKPLFEKYRGKRVEGALEHLLNHAKTQNWESS